MSKTVVMKNTLRLEELEAETITLNQLAPNSYNPNRQSDYDFELLCKSVVEDGFCVEASTPVLCADLVWRPAGDLQVGQALVAFDEEAEVDNSSPHGRRFRTATVTHNSLREDDLFAVGTAEGVVRCNAEHPWLVNHYGSMRKRAWVKTRDLRPGDRVVRLFEPWDVETTYSAGWLAGFLDGEGTLCVNSNRRNNNKMHRLAAYQKPGPTAERMIQEITRRVEATVHVHDRSSSNPKWSNMVMVRVDQLAHIMRLIGMVRPARLLKNGSNFWENRSLSGTGRGVEVQLVEPSGRGTIASLSTSTQTYIAQGFAMHNTQPILMQKSTPEITDGEHRWTALIVIYSLLLDGWTIDKLKSDMPSDELKARRKARLQHLERVGDCPIKVVRHDMTPEQMKIATLRHNRARGEEDIELSAALLRDLQAVGALEWVKDSLMMSDEEINRMIHDVGAAEALAGDEFSEAWEPEQRRAGAALDTTEGKTNADDGGQITSAASQQAVEAQRNQQQRLQDAKNEEERETVRQESKVHRLNLAYAGDEADLVRDILGRYPAEKLIRILRLFKEKGLDKELEAQGASTPAP